MNIQAIRASFALGTALTLSLAAPAFAQAASDQAAPAPAPAAPAHATGDAGGASDIIVTARRTEERLQDVPISITVFNQQQISNRNVTQPGELATYTPSLSANSNFGSENTSFAIRGFVQDAGTPPSVGVYFGDVVAPRGPTQGTQAGDTAGPGDFFDLQNVQVLKGPQGTLQGRNTTGGAILFVPQKPTSKTEGYIEGGYGNYDMHRVQAMFNTPLGEFARFRIAMDHMDRDGYLHNISGIGPKDYNNVDYTAVRASLVVDLTPDLENYTIASYSRSDTNGSVQKLIGCNPAGYDPVNPALGAANFIGVLSCGQLANEKARGAGFYDVEAAMPNPRSLITQWQIINTTTWKASDNLTVKNIASYAQFTDFQRSPLFGTDWTTANTPAIYSQIFFEGVPPEFTVINPAPGRDTADQSTFTEELQFQGNAMDDRLTWQAGGYFEVSNPLAPVGNQSNQLAECTNVNALQCFDPIGNAFSIETGFPVNVGAVNYTVGETSYRDVGLYGQATYKLTDKLSLTGGFRYTWDRQTNSSTRITNNFPLAGGVYTHCTDPDAPANCSQFLEQKSHKPTWLIDLDYKPTDDILVYGKWARGYRAGGVFANAPADHRTFLPEKVDSYEGGIKTSWRGPLRGTLDVSGFYNNLSNQQLQLGFNNNPDYLGTGFPSPASPTTAILNAGKSRIWGAEVEATVTPFAGLTFDGSYTYLNAKLKQIGTFTTTDPLYVAATGEIHAGLPLALSPKNKFSVTGTYTLPLDPSIGKIAFSATFTHTDKQLTNYVYLTPLDVSTYGSNLSYVPATNLLNLNVNWNNVAGRPVDLSLFATNVTQDNYYSFIPGLGGVVASGGSGSEFAVLGEPRMFGGRIRFRFGS